MMTSGLAGGRTAVVPSGAVALPRAGPVRGRRGGPARGRGACVNVAQRPDLLGGEGPLAADVAAEGQPPREQGPETVAVAGQERDVDEQPDPPAQEAADAQRAGGDDGAAAGDVGG